MKGNPNNVIHNLMRSVLFGDGYKHLENNWDSYGAKAISHSARALAKDIMVDVLLPREIYMNIGPTNKGGVAFDATEWDDGSYLEALPDGRIIASWGEENDTYLNSLDELRTYLDERLT